MVSYFGYEKVSGAQLLEASRLLPQEDVGDMKYFFMKAGWTPYYLEYEFTPKMTTTFESLIEYFFTDVELYMDMSEELEYVRVPNALRII